MPDIILTEYHNETSQALLLIKGFWLEHNGYNQTDDEALEDLRNWTQDGHCLYLISYQNMHIGFVHLGSRGGAIDWIEDIFVLPLYQNKGIGTHVIGLVEDMVRSYSSSLYIEAAARNEAAIRLYRNLGFDCLNTVSLRKDFNQERYETISEVTLYHNEFKILKTKNTEVE